MQDIVGQVSTIQRLGTEVDQLQYTLGREKEKVNQCRLAIDCLLSELISIKSSIREMRDLKYLESINHERLVDKNLADDELCNQSTQRFMSFATGSVLK
ncbi:hypothetical protein HDE_10701 [Halotydeus destructor]|nr:hypothetical protein HDE_10701 [Halotydeus destructor]